MRFGHQKSDHTVSLWPVETVKVHNNFSTISVIQGEVFGPTGCIIPQQAEPQHDLQLYKVCLVFISVSINRIMDDTCSGRTRMATRGRPSRRRRSSICLVRLNHKNDHNTCQQSCSKNRSVVPQRNEVQRRGHSALLRLRL